MSVHTASSTSNARLANFISYCLECTDETGPTTKSVNLTKLLEVPPFGDNYGFGGADDERAKDMENLLQPGARMGWGLDAGGRIIVIAKYKLDILGRENNALLCLYERYTTESDALQLHNWRYVSTHQARPSDGHYPCIRTMAGVSNPDGRFINAVICDQMVLYRGLINVIN